jgi:hypothetical protein
VDNLETMTDVASLLPTLRQLAGPSKFILTSRERNYPGAVYHYVLPELGEADALLLVRHEAGQSNVTALVEATDDELRPIYQTVGGNPLALRLVVGQAHVHDLPEILDELRAARGRAEALYEFIYRRAWEHLDEAARQALLAMPLIPPGGGRFEDLAAFSGMEKGPLRAALERLVARHLVDVRGPLGARRYSIHGLTRSFLEEAIALW